MNIIINKMETDDEIKGKSYVHWKSWHETYPGLVSQEYLDNLTLQKCEDMGFKWRDNILVAKDNGRVIGFIGYGKSDEMQDTGEIFALYVLSEYHGKGVGSALMEAGLDKLKDYKKFCLWAVKNNNRAIRFYQKYGFELTGEEKTSSVGAKGVRMVKIT